MFFLNSNIRCVISFICDKIDLLTHTTPPRSRSGSVKNVTMITRYRNLRKTITLGKRSTSCSDFCRQTNVSWFKFS